MFLFSHQSLINSKHYTLTLPNYTAQWACQDFQEITINTCWASSGPSEAGWAPDINTFRELASPDPTESRYYKEHRKLALTHLPSPSAVLHWAPWLQPVLSTEQSHTRPHHCLKTVQANGPAGERALLLPGGVSLLWPHPGSRGSGSFWPNLFSNTWVTWIMKLFQILLLFS